MENKNEQNMTVMPESEFSDRMKKERLFATKMTFDTAVQPILRFAKMLSEYNVEDYGKNKVQPFEVADMLRIMALGGYVESIRLATEGAEYHSFVASSDLLAALKKLYEE